MCMCVIDECPLSGVCSWLLHPSPLSSFFLGGWRASNEPLLMDFIDECAWWMTKVLDDHDISRKATMFDQAQNVKR